MSDLFGANIFDFKWVTDRMFRGEGSADHLPSSDINFTSGAISESISDLLVVVVERGCSSPHMCHVFAVSEEMLSLFVGETLKLQEGHESLSEVIYLVSGL